MSKFVVLIFYGLLVGLFCNAANCEEVQELENIQGENVAADTDVLTNSHADLPILEPQVRHRRQVFVGIYPPPVPYYGVGGIYGGGFYGGGGGGFYRRGFYGRRSFRRFGGRRRFYG
ncbi:uncharacterized protein LOC133323361 [Musca vetustissima]|uniref:uncharacterized protein LOC133323360 n=1 Tax=Musca vetustissima TaxID=27455 RepID=UPI002AB75BC9|nr:uncharacterized protein LOC133323360 [Musca vetustissima]XP_061388283.1 uncharacterized protein LOC133323361 [Musca vetustissima]